MGKVIELPESVVRKIAAGEVITRPVSVVKELMENSVDANAKRIKLSIEKGGKSLIEVMDDGEGMDEKDILMAIKPHTTSKIEKFEDIFHINSFGFRGEALPSIVSISETSIVSKTKESDLGTEVNIRASEVVSIRKVPFQIGTKVIVKNLFFNLPARRRFLSSAAIEGRMIGDLFQKFLLSLLDKHLIFLKDGVQIYNAPPASDPLERILTIFPELKKDDLIKFENEYEGFKVKGYVSRIGKGLKTRYGQIFFVNRRYVRVSLLYKIIDRIVKDVPLDKQPYVIAYLQIPGKFVDINVHPQKLEVNFSNPKLIFNLIYNALMDIYKSKKSIGKLAQIRESRTDTSDKKGAFIDDLVKPRGTELFERNQEYASFIIEKKDMQLENEDYRFFGILGGRYAILEVKKKTANGESKLVIMDVHGAHERVIYEEIKQFDRMESQILSIEIKLHLDDVRISVLKETMDIFRKFGFEIEIRENLVLLKAIPKILPISVAEHSILEFLDELKLFSIVDKNELLDSLRKKLAKMACSSALKTYEKMNEKDVIEIMKKMRKYGVKTCPHGRPVIMEASMKDLNRLFGRT